MGILLYNVNSFGGNYEYSKEVWKALESRFSATESIYFLLPANAECSPADNVFKILISDMPKTKPGIFRKLHFIYRSVANPIILWFLLLRINKCYVVFNDFEQLTSIFWVPFFLLLKAKHKFGFIIHDPNRDNFFPVQGLSRLSMHMIARLADIFFYHELLPDKSYYQNNVDKVRLPHGLYHLPPADESYMKQIAGKKADDLLLGILGNIRSDKNYDFVLQALTRISGVKLLVAGKPGTSETSTDMYHEYIKQHQLEDRVIWDERYLSEPEFAAAIQSCDIILLYYGRQSISQSGILNIIAPYQKALLISDSPGPIKIVVDKYDLGWTSKLFDEDDFLRVVNDIKRDAGKKTFGWSAYAEYASWSNNVDTIYMSFKNLG